MARSLLPLNHPARDGTAPGTTCTHTASWIVEVASCRVVRGPCPACSPDIRTRRRAPLPQRAAAGAR